MSKIRLTPIKPKKAERKLFKNGFVCLNPNSPGAHKFYIKMNGNEKVLDEERKEIVTMITFHPEDLRPPFINKMINRAKKTKKEWVSL
ncbi:MAG: hypothetical protein ACKKMV_00285 [Candidatus Nealsonbacteria bacterium]